jgi:hypothetical protein
LKAEIVKKQLLENFSGVNALEIIKGMIYILSASQKKLICLDPYLTIKYQIDLSDLCNEESNFTITNFQINDYPHLLVLEFGKKNSHFAGWLIKLPTPYNRKHIVWQKDFGEWYNLFEMLDDFAIRQPTIKTALTGSDYFALIAEVQNTFKILYFNKEEAIEYFQGHTESAPFPQMEDFIFSENQESELTLVDSLVYTNLWFGLSKNGQNEVFIHYRESKNFERIRGQEATPLDSVVKQTMLAENHKPFVGQLENFSISGNPEQGIYTAVAIEQMQAGMAIQLIEIAI